MLVEISNGELLDKISILELKLLKIEDEEKKRLEQEALKANSKKIMQE